MISLSVKVPGLDFIVGAAFQATFEGDSLFFSNQKIGETENCDILFRGNYGIKAEFGWNSEGSFYCNDVNFDDALVEISTIENSICIDIDPGTNKVFDKVKDDVVLISVDNEIEIFLARTENKIKNDITSPLGNEVLIITENAKKRIIKLINQRDSGITHKKKENPDNKKGQSTKVLNPENIENATKNVRKKSDKQNNKGSKPGEETPKKNSYNDVAWWTRSEAGWDEEVMPAGVDSEEFYENQDFEVNDNFPGKDTSIDLDDTYDEEFESNESDEKSDSSISSEIRESEFEIEYEKNWFLFKPSRIFFKMHNTIARGLTLTVIPRFPGCNVVPDKYMFNYESDSEIVFNATPARLGKCDDLVFEFWSSGSEFGFKKLGQKVNIKMPLLIKIIASILSTSLFMILLLFFVVLGLMSFNAVIISLGSFIILTSIYFGLNAGNKIIIETSKLKEEQS